MITFDSFSIGTPTLIPPHYIPKIQTFGHLPTALMNKLAETDVPQAPGNHTGAYILITHLTSMFMHWYTPFAPPNMNIGASAF